MDSRRVVAACHQPRVAIGRELGTALKTRLDMSGIPKFIHQTFSTRDSLPRQLEENINYLQGLNPDWVHEFYDDDRCEKFITDNYPQEYLNRYQRISHRYGAARADYFRYLLMYKRGGVYLDIKSTVIFPLSDVIPKNTSYLLSRWR